MVALPAVEVLLKNVTPPFPQVVMAASLVMAAPLPAVALLTNCIPPLLPDPSTAVTKFWAIPELFVIPTPLMSKTTPGLAVVVNALAPPLNTIPLTSVNGPPETEMPIMLEDANVAVSADPIGRATRRPVGCSVPVPSGRICQPGGAPGKAAARC